MQVGYPHELNRETWSDEQRAAMTQGHNDAWADASAKRHRFVVAQQAFVLVADDDSRARAEQLATWLDDTNYSGCPWGWKKELPRVALSPSKIEPEAAKVAARFAQSVARVSWGRSVSVDAAPPDGAITSGS